MDCPIIIKCRKNFIRWLITYLTMTFSSICSNDTILFKQQYEKLLAEFLFELHKLEIPEMATQWIKQMSDYNTLGGLLDSSLYVHFSYSIQVL